MADKDMDALRWNWDAPLIISPHNHKRLYFAANQLFRSDNMGDEWKCISPDMSRGIDRNQVEVMGRIQSSDAEVEGVSKGWTKELELVGVGYRASNQGQRLELALGFSHNIVFQIPSEVKIETVSEKGKNPIIKLMSLDKQLVGAIASKIRGFRKPEPYKGKGVKYVGEQIRRKAGKSA